MSAPSLSIVVPTRDRPDLLRRAIRSALDQTLGGGIEVVVVDDGSDPPVDAGGDLPPDDRLTVRRHGRPRGGAAARNTGARAARGRFVAFLDDDDELLPRFAEVSLAGHAASDLPQPVGVLSALAAVDPSGAVREIKRPQRSPRGRPYALTEPEPGRSFFAKQTLVVEREVLLDAGGWDEAFRSRVHTELFLRLNQVCSLEAVDEVTYRLLVHPGPRVSRDPRLRQESYDRLLEAHGEAFAAYPRGAARFHIDHAERSWDDRRVGAAGRAAGRALRRAPVYATREFAGRVRRRIVERGSGSPTGRRGQR